jgi:P-type Cu+ transporter
VTKAAGTSSSGREGPAQLRLPVGGMTCAACVHHVEAALRTVDGVTGVSVNLITRSATIDVDGAADGVDADLMRRLVVAVEQAGYLAHVPSADDDVLAEQRRADAHALAEANERLIRALVALVTACVTMLLSMPLMHGSGAGSGAGAGAGGDDALTHVVMAVLDPPLRAAMPWLYALSATTLRWLILGGAIPVLAFVTAPLVARAWAAARHGSTDMHTLVVLGALASLVSSLRGEMAIDAALFIVGFVLLGQAAEARARGRASAALSVLAAERVEIAHRELDDGQLVDLQPRELRRGDIVVVKPGERSPGDGVVVDGTGSVDESLLSGESRPVDKGVGDTVLGGSVNGRQPLKVRLTRLGDDSTWHRLMTLMRDAQARRAPMQRLADRVAAVFVPSMLALAAATWIGWWLVGDVDRATHAAVAVLVVACPCAMGLAIPTAVVAATGRAARHGILLKGGDVLERLAGIDVVIFDKTGTLTRGRPAVTDVIPAAGTSAEDVLALAAGLERGSEHPLARAVCVAADERGIKPKWVKGITTVAGAGLRGTLDGRVVGIGNARLVSLLGVSRDEQVQARALVPEDADQTPLVVVDTMAAGPSVCGVVVTSDALRNDASAAVMALRALSLEVAMLSGDRRPTALSVGRRLGLGDQQVVAEVLPEDKLAHIETVRRTRSVAFVGDGVNDAAALAAATVGVSLAEGTELAAAAADVVLWRPSLMAVVDVVRLARATRRIMIENLVWAFGYNVVMLPLAMGLLSPLGLRLSPVLAAIAMSCSSVTVVLNSLRLQRFTLADDSLARDCPKR